MQRIINWSRSFLATEREPQTIDEACALLAQQMCVVIRKQDDNIDRLLARHDIMSDLADLSVPNEFEHEFERETEELWQQEGDLIALMNKLRSMQYRMLQLQNILGFAPNPAEVQGHLTSALLLKALVFASYRDYGTPTTVSMLLGLVTGWARSAALAAGDQPDDSDDDELDDVDMDNLMAELEQ
eukprot:TRINITY_DN40092_c0_g1_i1.p1 TRINITY_DN40092_c0_g1~~TRINITY_DN40092_c0_g1_i1.p1  ORF type:complete len:209 (+),score=74.76 TRINITY_DN40092_c0_g1_i1:73-627(+)